MFKKNSKRNMYISINNLIYFVILPFIFVIGIASYYRQQSREWYHLYDEERDKNQLLYKELKEYKEKELSFKTENHKP